MNICVIGAGSRFLSGITVYTYRLTNALSHSHQPAAILMRQLLPTFLYPGRRRVGKDLTQLEFRTGVPSFDGVDWFWIPSMLRAAWFLWRQHPDAIVFQWWTGAVAHSYLLLALLGKARGAQVVIEFHEVSDTGEQRLALARQYVRKVAPLLFRQADGFVVHSAADRELLKNAYRVAHRPVTVIPHGPYDHYKDSDAGDTIRAAPAGVCNLLFFGIIRPYKGLEILIAAFNALPPHEAEHYWLTIVGETWEGWTSPNELIENSPYRERITFVNHYVPDAEVGRYFRGADVVVLPYLRSHASGPLNVAMGYGLPTIVTAVGGLVEAVAGYEGAVLIPPGDAERLQQAIFEVRGSDGRRFHHPHDWMEIQDLYSSFLQRLAGDRAALEPSRSCAP